MKFSKKSNKRKKMNGKVLLLLYHGPLGGVLCQDVLTGARLSVINSLWRVKEALQQWYTVTARLLWYSKSRRRAVLKDKAILAPLTHECHTKPSSKQSLFLTGMQRAPPVA